MFAGFLMVLAMIWSEGERILSSMQPLCDILLVNHYRTSNENN